MADRPRFSKTQLGQYLDRIAVPAEHRLYDVSGIADGDKFKYLSLLEKHHLIRIPFENLTLHYSWHRVIDVSPRHLFSKVVAHPSRGRGGYCMEVNTLFHTLLLSLGFDVSMAGARVYDPGRQRYGGFSHCVNIVTVAGVQYMVDVAFGANGPTRPVPMEPGHEGVHIEPASVRLVNEPIPQNLNQRSKVWIYQHRINEHADWVPMYCFVDLEFIPEDIRAMNLSPWKSPTSFFTQKIIVTRFTTAAEDISSPSPGVPNEAAVLDCGIDGALIVDHDKFKWRRNGVTVLERTFDSDDERLDYLRRYFGIELADEDADAIAGTAGQISR
ncbi:hypothetical protein JX265_013316 [Neoarthrinium moseri]|uniref:Arylamine N-acetyltransferase n=1 Tax=Neoarthrinium moseri TaxID=1658444 RepID=A0A9P9W997_9PEZI|nr:uncharacterized protein JN550_013356 [Neoarthrinium moseri]KAI1843434.1 hypothetical protein JX266_010431 [Neoarthrinium moseri]KAI1850836.1 hypothetical protein JX265_013316 [Neoarthrinium moseri]KAI1857273.1 hypothetical protein JN550_013356 [Neoarthrinium moseri]